MRYVRLRVHCLFGCIYDWLLRIRKIGHSRSGTPKPTSAPTVKLAAARRPPPPTPPLCMLSFRPHEIHFREVMKQVFDVPHKIYSGTGQQNKKKSNETFAVRNKSDVIMEGPQQQRRLIHLPNVLGVILRREFHVPPARSVL